MENFFRPTSTRTRTNKNTPLKSKSESSSQPAPLSSPNYILKIGGGGVRDWMRKNEHEIWKKKQRKETFLVVEGGATVTGFVSTGWLSFWGFFSLFVLPNRWIASFGSSRVSRAFFFFVFFCCCCCCCCCCLCGFTSIECWGWLG